MGVSERQGTVVQTLNRAARTGDKVNLPMHLAFEGQHESEH